MSFLMPKVQRPEVPPPPITADASQRANARPALTSIVGGSGGGIALNRKASTQKSSLIGGA